MSPSIAIGAAIRAAARALIAAGTVVAAIIVVTGTNGAAAGPGPWRHEVPPPVGTVLLPQYGLYRCASIAGARYMAETGFLAADCTRLRRAPAWRVIACRDDTVSHGALRLLEVEASDGTRGWVPLPWHDWA